MAGRVKATSHTDSVGSTNLIPARCPVEDKVWLDNRCASLDKYGNLSICPFLYGLEVLVDARWQHVRSTVEIGALLNSVDAALAVKRSLCLKQESKDTPAGA